jgi:hypothetical protein
MSIVFDHDRGSLSCLVVLAQSQKAIESRRSPSDQAGVVVTYTRAG